ncbi:SDR family oxidoreductase [Actinomycetospora chiangmaiensis]|uniref:SDR family oxidoreductase n=1 Tax=Actinomycetospora chiangmaiensis TaxID=402650 RepID=UPI0003694341|nr:SDR family oxidoreductase [Actinomycetospora chiangmaiensis]
MSRHPDLTGLVVAVTGGARGIGLATARALVARGALVAIGDLDAEHTAAVATGVDPTGTRVVGLPLDVADRASFAAFLEAVTTALGPVDVLVNNAGIMPLGPLVDETDARARRIVDVNLHGVLHGVKLAAPAMVARGRGHIVNVSSAVGRVALAGAATYSATKYAVVGLTEALRSELEGTGVDASVVIPMIVSTELGSGLGTVTGQRTVSAEEVAEAIVAVIRRPRFETWVPSTGRPLYVAMTLLPRAVRDGLSGLLGAAKVLARADVDARRAYDERVGA